VVGFRDPVIVSVIVSVDRGKREVIVSAIVSVLAHVQKPVSRAQEIIVSVGKYPYFFHRINDRTQ
jgi:hypothetical protein